MAEQYYSDPRNVTFGNRNVEIKFDRLNAATKRDLRNFFSNYALERETGALEGIDIPAGAIEDLVIRRGLKSLVIGTTNIQFTGSSPVDSFPDDFGMGDEEGEPDLYEEVLKTGVDKNRWLGRKYPFSMVFAQYLSMVNADKQEAEEKTAKEAEARGKVAPEPEKAPENGVGDDPLESPEDTPTVTRLSGSALEATTT